MLKNEEAKAIEQSFIHTTTFFYNHNLFCFFSHSRRAPSKKVRNILLGLQNYLYVTPIHTYTHKPRLQTIPGRKIF